MAPDITTLEAEIHRLSALVAALAEKNLLLETELARCRIEGNKAEGLNSNPMLLSASDGGSMLRTVDHSAIADGSFGKRFDRAATMEGSLRQKNDPQAVAEGLSRTPTIPSVVMNGSARHGIDRFASEHAAAPSELHPEENATALPPTLPEAVRAQLASLLAVEDRNARLNALAATLPDVPAIAAALRAGPMPQLRRPQERNLPLLLRALCRPESDRTPYPELQQATGLSYTGVYKLLQVAVRQGLAQRAGWQRYRLSEAGIALLEAARG